MVTTQNFCRNEKCPITDNNKAQKKVIKKIVSKKISFAPKL